MRLLGHKVFLVLSFPLVAFIILDPFYNCTALTLLPFVVRSSCDSPAEVIVAGNTGHPEQFQLVLRNRYIGGFTWSQIERWPLTVAPGGAETVYYDADDQWITHVLFRCGADWRRITLNGDPSDRSTFYGEVTIDANKSVALLPGDETIIADADGINIGPIIALIFVLTILGFYLRSIMAHLRRATSPN